MQSDIYDKLAVHPGVREEGADISLRGQLCASQVSAALNPGYCVISMKLLVLPYWTPVVPPVFQDRP